MAKQEIKLETLRHSTAHVMAKAAKRLFPKTALGIGPVIEDGFYYDFDTKKAISSDSFPLIEEEMRRIIAAHELFKKEYLSISQALALFKKLKEPYKIELIRDLAKKGAKKVSIYRTGTDFLDLCAGPHVRNTADIPHNAFKLIKAAAAYWRGDEKNPQLKRIYGTIFFSNDKLAGELNRLEEIEKRDHKKLGRDLDLFTFSELIGSGLPLWTPKGTIIRTLLDEFIWKLRETRGYERVEVPHITKKELYEISGHWEKFKDELFKITTREGHLFAMKPMNCPHHIQIFKRRPWSYRELPQRYANTTMVYRDEQTGELSGLSRVRCITQDDAHVFCRNGQAKKEMMNIWDIIDTFYGAFGFELTIRVSLHDPKKQKRYLGDKKTWRLAETELIDLAKSRGARAPLARGEAAFYGPKIDFLAKDSLGRKWQVATIQLDMNLPERFDITCIDEQGKTERLVMIHAAIMGSIERFLSILIEHFAGDFPVWLAPVQVRIIPVSERHKDYAETVRTLLSEKNIRVEVASGDTTIGKAIRSGELSKIPYLAVVGDREAEAKTVSVRERKQTELRSMSPRDLAEVIRAKRPF
ncbi:MAG: threonine--tRNA ligase [Candidatus Terrybacteria bacterium RIFCSPHIGHO2_01_FULL_48_17]|uniref:Threonine--tRNA ligase n=1 Tax=Candidatus Terrybacteria bacterium RIFCSPHIGHO2_01_FULL_48_17 TaxID=1802362 RepID=A0A1G2PH14_9BACT|nr:MAG: threonine--tRNA ligase [Candidatus Terrybacteria bacterium RIFCSPHIGHO2_01_FULL_48_17]OHA53120.1 MAG: threonine--tRNA ligase [Candidatus Terrybacteria bacterium RIFCSPLOWO2_01_FULL_48_14]